ncbi:hypothetical protein PFISCL1PPCAC_5387, partial [Pristionchus fissidentatus]
ILLLPLLRNFVILEMCSQDQTKCVFQSIEIFECVLFLLYRLLSIPQGKSLNSQTSDTVDFIDLCLPFAASPLSSCNYLLHTVDECPNQSHPNFPLPCLI